MRQRRGEFDLHDNSQSLPILASQGAKFDPAIAGLGQKY